MRVIIRNYETGEEINRVSVKEDDFAVVIGYLNHLQKFEDILKLGRTDAIKKEGFGLGIHTYYTKDCIVFTKNNGEKVDKMNNRQRQDSVSNLLTNNPIPDTIKFYDKDTGLRIELYGYKEGLVINTGQKIAKGLLGLGGTQDSYYKKITSKKVYFSGIANAKTFSSPYQVMKYIQKKEDTFKYLIKKNGYKYSVDYVTEDFKSDIESLDEKKKKKWDKDMEALNEYLEKLNSLEKEERPLPAEINEETIQTECIERMKDLELSDDVINYFKNGKILMSEITGIAKLDDNAKKAIEIARKHHIHPYHIIHTPSQSIGDLYDVLYVSEITEEWCTERIENNCLGIMSYNATYDDIEYGDIEVVSNYERLIRTS